MCSPQSTIFLIALTIFSSSPSSCVSPALTEPDVVRNLTVTSVTTSSVSLSWTEPVGNSSFYIVEWTGGNVTVGKNATETSVTISDLTAGVQYEITVTAVAGDGRTTGESSDVSRFTSE